MMKMTEKWIHRECAKEDINPEYVLVQPPLSRSHTPCAKCNQPSGHVFLYDVVEGPEPVSEAEPELEVVAVLEEVENKTEDIGAKFVDEAGNDVKLEEVFDKTVELTKEKIEEANEKETEIAKLKAELAELEK